MAAKVTLVKVVTSAIPNYVMQTSSIPKTICTTIDRYHRGFLWGNNTEKRKIHKVKWKWFADPSKKAALVFDR